MNPKTHPSFTLVFILLLILGQHSYAQDKSPPPSFQFEIFEMPGDVPGNHVQCITQDSFGFMWFASQSGLHRWDGYQFKTYLNDPFDSTSISSNYTEYIYVAKDSTLWIGTWGGGLNHFDPTTDKFTRYLHNPDDKNSINSNYISTILEDDKGNLWVGTILGLNRINLKTKKIKHFTNDPNDSTSLSHRNCRTIYIDREKTLWVGTGFPWDPAQDGGLNRYHPETESFTRYLHRAEDPSSLIHNKVSEIFEDSKGNFWIGTCGDGLHLMDRESGKFTRLTNTPENKHQLSTPLVVANYDRHTKFVFEDQEQKLWIGSWSGGIKYFDPISKHSEHFFQGDQRSNSIPDNSVWTLFQARDGTLWGSTAQYNAKVFKIVKQNNYFDILPFTLNDLVMGFWESTSGVLWFSEDAKGLIKIDPSKGDTFQYLDDPKHPKRISLSDAQPNLNQSLLFQNIDRIAEDQNGILWLGKGYNNGLVKFNPLTGETRTYFHDPEDEYSLGSNDIIDILMDANGNIWVSTDSGDLNLYNPETDNFTRFQFFDKHDVFNNDIKLTLARDGTIWVIYAHFNDNKRSILVEQFDPNISNNNKKLPTLASVSIEIKGILNTNGIKEDIWGNIWVSTENSLHRIDPATYNLTSYHSEQFNSSHFNGMVTDEQGMVWLAGDRLIFFDPTNETHIIYNCNSGVKHNPFQFRSIFEGRDGKIFFSSRQGIYSFYPNQINKKNPSKNPQVAITEFQLLGNQANPSLARLITNQKTIHLRYDQNIFSFRFSAFDFHEPASNQHKFLLENYDEQWRVAGIDPVASYVKVPPGTYTFRVKASNHLGVWGEEKSIRLIITPPWWKTWWAQGCFYALILAMIFGFYRFLLKRNLEQAEALRIKELDAIKTQLYTNITHEFRTPLTVISGMTKQIKENPKVWFNEGLAMIHRNTNRLLDLVNQMLDLSKLESGKMALNLQQGDIINYLKYLVESFHSFAESKKVQLHFYAEEDELTMDFDPEKIQQIISNLLSNAIKFTPKNGHIYVSTHSVNEGNVAGSNNLMIKVRDTGNGIPETQIPHIFDRFYQVDDTAIRHAEGTGIGLALVKELVKLLKGTITVTSKLGKGTVFFLTLPIKNEAPEFEESLNKTIGKSTHAEVAYSVNATTHIKKEQEPTPINDSKSQILLIEDNPDVVAYIASCLQAEYHIKVGRDGQEGIDIALKNIPDLIITDVMMPYKDGFEVARTLKKDERTSHIPIIMLTARADIESKLKGLEKGVDAYLAKPFNKAELLIRIKKLLELRASLRQHYCTLAGLTDQPSFANDLPDLESIENNFVKRARAVVEEHLDDFNFDIDQFSKEMNLSRSQLHRKLSALIGFSGNKFIRYVRLNKAKALLQNPQLSITAVAFDTGFNDPSYFGRVFKKEFDMTPKEWQEKV